MFVKQADPHEEALMILKGQMSHPAVAPGTQVRGAVGLGPGRTEDKAGPPGASGASCPCERWPCRCPWGPPCWLSTFFWGDRCPERMWPW